VSCNSRESTLLPLLKKRETKNRAIMMLMQHQVTGVELILLVVESLSLVIECLDRTTRGGTNCQVQSPVQGRQVLLVNVLHPVAILIHIQVDHLKEAGEGEEEEPVIITIVTTTLHHHRGLIPKNPILINDQAAVSKIPSSLVIVQVLQLICHRLCNSSSNLEYNSSPIHNIPLHSSSSENRRLYKHQ